MSARAAVLSLLATVAVVAGCTSGPTPVGPTPTPTPTPTSTPTPTPTSIPIPTPTSAAGTDYRAALDAIDRDLAVAFADIVDADGYEDLRAALQAARAATGRAATSLAATSPPSDRVVEYERVLRGLDDLGAALTVESDRVETREHCAASAVEAALAADPSVTDLRSAVTSTPGWGSFLPAPPPAPPASPPSGTLVVSPSEPGPGRFEVVNNRDVDVLIVLTDVGVPVLSMAVGAGQEAATDVVPDGTYEVYVAGGLEPDGAGGFARRCTHERLDEVASFRSTAESTTVLELTLDVIDGNVTATDVAPDDFPR